MAATIKEIAAEAKVSIATVSRALNNDPRVTKERRSQISRIAKRLEYRPNLLARNFARKKSNLVGLILPEISDEYFTEIIKGVDETVFSQNLFTLVASSHKYKSLENEIITLIKNSLISGLILLVSNLDEKLFSILSKSHLPVVVINSNNRFKKFDRVGIDNYQGSYSMTTYLINKKHYDFLAHITGPLDNDDAQLRRSGFIDACKKYKMKYIIEEGDFSREGGFAACKNLLDRSKPPKVIFAANDMMAIGCYDYLKQSNIQIPREVGVVGFDDIFVSQYLTPPLTTVKVNIEEVGKKAAELLLRKMQSTNGIQSSVINIPTELVIRESC
ncbi:MAG: LacI family DNA-binding transcriptional regulator [bacterium]|nr:LacI family DNA-binding transcriptional regulator [bacterium]